MVETLRALNDKGANLSIATLVDFLCARGARSAADAHKLVNSFDVEAACIWDFETFECQLEERHKRRQIVTLAERARELAEDPTADLDAVRREFLDLGEVSARTNKGREWLATKELDEWSTVELPKNWCLAGDNHFSRGSMVVVGGPPGVGKSRLVTGLALAGAVGRGTWMGVPIHRKWRTLILQAENGRHRLKQESAAIVDNPSWSTAVKGQVRISDCPPGGLPFHRLEFRAAVRTLYASWPSEMVVIDPWNRATPDEAQKDYMETFENIAQCFPGGDDAPCFVVVAHLRKPRMEGIQRGRSLLAELSGSQSLTSVARSVFVVLPGSSVEGDDRVVLNNPKNNDGALLDPSAWHRRNGLFEPVAEFDWNAFWSGGAKDPDKARSIGVEHLDRIFHGGKRKLSTAQAAKELQEVFGFGRSASYGALKRFEAELVEDSDGLLTLKEGQE